MIHELKTWPRYFEAIASCEKTFEVRKYDRSFKVGDFLALNEYETGYTGRCMIVRVTYILDDAEYCKEGYCVMGIDGAGIITHQWSVNLPMELQYATGIPVYDRE